MHKQRWLDAAKAAGIEQLEIYEQKSRSTSIRLFEGSVDGYTISECNGFAIRGIYKGNMGICFLEQDDDALLEDTLCRIKENAEVITSRDEVEIYAGDSAYPPAAAAQLYMECTSGCRKDRNAEDGGAVYKGIGCQNRSGYEYQLWRSRCGNCH